MGALVAGFTFMVFEGQAVLVARFLAGRIKLSSKNEQIQCVEDRTAYQGYGVPFTALYHDFEQYFEEVRPYCG